MKVFKDVFSGDELCSDIFKMTLVDDLIYEFEGKNVIRKENEIILTGSNPSAEGEEEDLGTDENVESGIDFVLNHRLQPVYCYEDKDTFKSYIKDYSKKVVKYMQDNNRSNEDVTKFKEKLLNWVKTLLDKTRFKELQFFIGENMAEGKEEGQVAIVEYRNNMPFMMLIKEGIIEEKI